MSSERFAFRDSQSPAVSIVSGGVPESPPPGSFPQEECGSGFFGLSVIHPLGVIVDIYRGAPPCYERERPTNELPTLDPLGSRVGPNQLGGRVYTGSYLAISQSVLRITHTPAYRSRSFDDEVLLSVVLRVSSERFTRDP